MRARKIEDIVTLASLLCEEGERPQCSGTLHILVRPRKSADTLPKSERVVAAGAGCEIRDV